MEPQLDRQDRTRPTVRCEAPSLNYWQARGYDANGNFHVEGAWSLPEAHRIATEWATNGYPEADA